jgi:hypothetical protein
MSVRVVMVVCIADLITAAGLMRSGRGCEACGLSVAWLPLLPWLLPLPT